MRHTTSRVSRIPRTGAPYQISPRLRQYHADQVERLVAGNTSIDPSDLARMSQALRSFWLAIGMVSEELAAACILCESVVTATIFFQGIGNTHSEHFVAILGRFQQCLMDRMASDPSFRDHVERTVRAKFPKITQQGVDLVCGYSLPVLMAEDGKTGNPAWDIKTGLPEDWYIEYVEILYLLVRQYLFSTIR